MQQISFCLLNEPDLESIEFEETAGHPVGDREHGHEKVVMARYLGLSQGKKQLKLEAVISLKCN